MDSGVCIIGFLELSWFDHSKNVILSSDCGVSILPKPHLGFYQFIKQVHELGFTMEEIDYMIKTNSKKLFRI